jgi:hybrid cluster-associated redox disulfide protein
MIMAATTITKDTVIGDILDIAPETIPAFLDMGMHCLGCPASRGETVEEACQVHGVDPETLVGELNQLIVSNQH